jgi:hypothetical protein
VKIFLGNITGIRNSMGFASTLRRLVGMFDSERKSPGEEQVNEVLK